MKPKREARQELKMAKFKRHVPAKKKGPNPSRRGVMGSLFYEYLRQWYWGFRIGFLVWGLVFLVLAGFVMHRYVTWFLGWE